MIERDVNHDIAAPPNLSRAKDLMKGTLYNGKVGSYPLNAFFLYSDMDEDLAEFVKEKGYWLHCLSGNDCLIGAFENPEHWGTGWKNHWQEKLGFLYWSAQEEWTKLETYDRNSFLVIKACSSEWAFSQLSE